MELWKHTRTRVNANGQFSKRNTVQFLCQRIPHVSRQVAADARGNAGLPT